jgi:hypothetical protein
MTMHRLRAYALGLLVLAAAGALAPAARAHDDHDDECRIKEVTSITPASANAGTYTPPALPTARPVTITINLRTDGEGTCKGSLAFNSYGPPLLQRVGGGGSMPYMIQTAAAGGTPLIYTGTDPDNRRLDFTLPSRARSVTVLVYVLMQPTPAAPIAAGAYSDGLLLQVFNRKAWDHLTLAGSRPFTVAGTVAQVCQLPPPDVANVNFTSAISNGLPNPGIVATVRFTNVSCTAPAHIRLSGQRLEPSAPLAPVAAFDNFIHWRASATFGAAAATLDTRTASQATSATHNVVSGAVAGATITVDINLLRGQRVLAGSYSNILTVTIDPSL